MTTLLGVLMDPIALINYKKDSTLALLMEAARRDFGIYYFQQKDLFMLDGEVFANAQSLNVYENEEKWFELGNIEQIPLTKLNIVLMRKDPPFDLQYIYTTYLLERAELKGVKVINKPQSLRECNEKIFTAWFPQCTPPTLVTRSISLLRQFYKTQGDIVCKPLDGMGGASVFRVQREDVNASVIFETLTHLEQHYIMAQKFIPEISQGDKRILMINGVPIPFALARVPAHGELRGNLAAGATGRVQPLSKQDYWIAEQVGPVLKARGLLLVGLDVIGGYLTEVNVTSPTCIREIDKHCNINIAKIFFDQVLDEI